MGFTAKQIEALCLKVDDLFADAPTRVRNVLRYPSEHSHLRETYYLGQLLAHTEQDFLYKIPHSSKYTANYVEETLRGAGYALGALAAFRDQLVGGNLPDEETFKQTLRDLPIAGKADLSAIARNAQKDIDAEWMRKHLPANLSTVSADLIVAAIDDPRVQRKFTAFVDLTAQVVRERLRRETGAPQYTQGQLDILAKKVDEVFSGSAVDIGRLFQAGPKHGSERIEYFAQLISYTHSELSKRYNVGAMAVSAQITGKGGGFRVGDLEQYKEELTTGFNRNSSHLSPSEKDAAFTELVLRLSTGALNREGGPV